jgi:Protein of unknown function (DUF2924)/Restriction Enzyme Adenine Methylase Associated
MPSIDIDFDVFKALTARRASEHMTENDVLRQLFNLGKGGDALTKADSPAPDDWVTKGVRLPSGTELRSTYKGKAYLARVNSGALVLQGRRFDSPSAAAMSITGSPVNGWTFWQCKLPGQDRWQILKSLRRST